MDNIKKSSVHHCSHEYFGELGSFAVKISTPSSVISKVCSNCADGSPSLVAAVHLSGHITGLLLFMQIMGSMVKVWPTSITPLR